MTENRVIKEDIKEIVEQISQYYVLLSGKTILITGGLGFIGRYMVGTLQYLNKYILKKPSKIIIIDNYITSEGNKLFIFPQKDKPTFIKHNVTKPLNISGNIDYIIHAAGIASPAYYQKYPLETIDVAVMGTRNMLEVARKKRVKGFLFFSSSEVYGDPLLTEIPTKETYRGNVSSLGHRACYDESKRLGETLCMTYLRLYKMPIKIVRPFNIFGPGMRSNDYRVIPSFLFNALVSKPLRVHADGKQTRTFCYITDAVVSFFLVLLAGGKGEVYNVGNDQNEITMNRLAGKINKIFQQELKIINIPYPENYPRGEPQRRCPNLAKIKKDLGYQQKVDLETGLVRTLNWSRNNWI